MAYDKELAFAKDLAREAGKIMKRYFRATDRQTEWKEDNSPLTIADTTINQLVIDRVIESFPDCGVIGEEQSFETDRQLVWVVDPIDGTMPYNLGIPLSTFSLALVDKQDGQPIVGATLDPVLDILYWATKAGGAFMNGVAIHTSTQTEFSRNAVYLGGSFKNDEHEGGFQTGAVLDTLRDTDVRCLNFVSFVYAANRVADGALLSAVLDYGSPWDSAAACLIVREAGGVVSDELGRQRRYDEFASGSVMSANEAVHAKMLAALETGRR